MAKKFYTCDFCGRTFIAAQKRRFCTPEHRSHAFANYYTASLGPIISIKAPKTGWTYGQSYEFKPVPGIVLTLKVGTGGKFKESFRRLPYFVG